MKRSLQVRRASRSWSVLGAAAILCCGGASFALVGATGATPTTTTARVFSACLVPSSNGGSLISVTVSPATPVHCPTGLVQVSWSSAGAPGSAGPSGPSGPAGVPGPSGPAGVAGSPGPQGPQGSPGAAGVAGPTGPTGPSGASGANGLPGANGNSILNGTGAPAADLGSAGDFYLDTSTFTMYGPKAAEGWPGSGQSLIGPQGAIGSPGAPGSPGAAGATGSPGPSGPSGPSGPAGPTGPAGIANYAYFYNTLPQFVLPETDVAFDTNGVTVGFVHPPFSPSIITGASGTYKITFSVSAVEPNEMALFVNGLLVPGSTYGSGAGTQQNTGQAIVTLVAGDVLTLRNHGSFSPADLAPFSGGTQPNVDASLIIEMLG